MKPLLPLKELAGKIWFFLSPADRRKFAVIVVLLVVSAILNMAGIGSVMPFVSILANPEVVESPGLINTFHRWCGSPDTSTFLAAAGLLVMALFIAGNLLQMLVIWLNYNFIEGVGRGLQHRLFSHYVSQPYSYFLGRNSAELSKNIFSDVAAVTDGVLIQSMTIVVSLFTIIATTVVIVVVNPWVAVSVGGGIAAAYLLIMGSLKHFLARASATHVEANRVCFKVAYEAFGGIKDVKLRGCELGYRERFKAALESLKHAGVGIGVAMSIPKPFFELVAIGVFLALILALFAKTGSVAGFLPLISVYAVAVYRLLPALQNAYAGATAIRGKLASVQLLYDDMMVVSTAFEPSGDKPPTLDFKNQIELNNVCFTYPGSDVRALAGINIAIPRHAVVGFVGPTGCGKTTVVDIILGLLTVSGGAVKVDGTTLDTSRLPAWRRKLGYVSQTIYLSDDTIARNIAFGVDYDKIDMSAVRRAAETANILNFIENDLPGGFDTVVGERGVRLSGGQRQRIGIARALYHQPEVLVMDEATSALDTVTEKAIMEAVDNLHGSATIIIIAHRITTVKCCDKIFVMEKGAIVDEGKYEDLIERNSSFQAFAG